MSEMRMNEQKNAENEDYQFIREKIVSKKRNKIKRWCLISLGVIVLALVFGFLARLTFILSEDLAKTVLGISSTPTPTVAATRAPIELPSSTPKVTNTPTPIPTPTESLSPTPDEKPEATSTPTPIITPEVKPTEAPSDVTGGAIFELYNEVKRIADKAGSSMVRVSLVSITTDWFGEQLETEKLTSGVIIGNNGIELLVLVSNSRIEKTDRIDIYLADKLISGVEVFAANPEYDLAILAVPVEQIPEAELENIVYAKIGDSKGISVGSPVIAVGNPNGYFGSYEVAMITTEGDFAYVTDNRIELYNTTMRENSEGDGVVVNMSGEVVGIITHTFKEDKNASIATVIGVNHVKSMLARLANISSWNYFGVVAKEAPDYVLSKLRIENGLYVTEVQEGSPAELAGIKKGDILTKFGETLLVTVDNLADVLEASAEGASVEVELMRGTAESTKLEVTLITK